MLYIKLPEHAEFKQLEVVGENGMSTTKDCIVLKNNEVDKTIDLQSIVKNILQHCPRGVKEFKTGYDGLIIHKRKPPYDDNMYLEYKPNKNGKLPSEHHQIIIGKNCKPYNPGDHSSSASCSRWVNHHIFFNEEQKKNQMEKDRQKQLSRRKSSSTPFAN